MDVLGETYYNVKRDQRTQEEFYADFNAYMRARRQDKDRPSKELEDAALTVANRAQEAKRVDPPENVVIQDNVFIGPGAIFTNDKYAPSKGKWRDEPPTTICNNVSIGAGSVILPNLTIGENAKIGAGSVVTRDVYRDAIVIGNPAKPMHNPRVL